MKILRVFYIKLMRDITMPKTQYLIKVENQEPFYFEVPYDYIPPRDELVVLKKELTRAIFKDSKVGLQFVRGKIVSGEE